MILFKKIPFSFEERLYEVRIYYDDKKINLLVFRDNYPVNGFRNQINIPRKSSPESFLENSVIEELVSVARQDILEKRWNRFLKAN